MEGPTWKNKIMKRLALNISTCMLLSSCTISYHSKSYYIAEPGEAKVREIIVRDSITYHSRGSLVHPNAKSISKK
jgi:hypothetical protein